MEVEQCVFEKRDNVSIHLSASAPRASTLTFRSPWLELMPVGHRQFLSIRDADGTIVAERMLSALSDTATVELKGTGDASSHVFAEFLALGFKHILAGYDHLLFLLSLLIVCRGFAGMLKLVTCFTVAHSVTLALATVGTLHIPAHIVEPLIAATLVYIGVENLIRREPRKERLWLVFAFGLIHGLGFASVLIEMGVGSTGRSVAGPLLSFNLGVELGQVMIAALVLPLFHWVQGRPELANRWATACSALVAIAGGWWLVERVCF